MPWGTTTTHGGTSQRDREDLTRGKKREEGERERERERRIYLISARLRLLGPARAVIESRGSKSKGLRFIHEFSRGRLGEGGVASRGRVC